MLYISHPTVDSWWWCVTNAFSLLEHHRLCHPVTHLAHTSSGSIHTVTSCGRQRSAGVSSLSSHAFSTSSSQRTPLFIRMHLWRTRCSLSLHVEQPLCSAVTPANNQKVKGKMKGSKDIVTACCDVSWTFSKTRDWLKMTKTFCFKKSQIQEEVEKDAARF